MKCFKSIIAALLLAAISAPATAQTSKPAEVDLGIFTFTSGPGAAYGVPGRNAADVVISQINASGGIGGVPVKPIYVDEGQGTNAVVAEFRKLSSDSNNQVMIAALSSANCLALAPVAEQLQMPTFMWNCDTHQLFLKDKYKYVYRTNSSTVPEFVADAIDAVLNRLLITQRANTTPFSVHSDDAPTVYITGNPAPTAPVTRTLEHDLDALVATNPITGNTDKLSVFLADQAEMKLLHMVTSSPARTPSLTMFGDPDYFFQTSTPTACAAQTDCVFESPAGTGLR